MKDEKVLLRGGPLDGETYLTKADTVQLYYYPPVSLTEDEPGEAPRRFGHVDRKGSIPCRYQATPETSPDGMAIYEHVPS